MIVKFGNWKLEDEAIIYFGERYPNEYDIGINQLQVEGSDEREGCYNMLIHMVDKLWIDENDLNDMNNIFLYAFGYYNVKLDYNRFLNTMKIQKEELKYK